ncbi:MAG: ATP-binding protein [Hyphomicrobiales bacterium]
MRLERVLIEGFGPLTMVDVTLEPKRLNLLIGPNESGKSSFASAVLATLFGFANHESEASTRPWAGKAHKTALVFSAGAGRYRLRRDFETHEVIVEQLALGSDDPETTLFRGVANPRGRSAELLQYEELLRGWFGFTDARLFRESAFVHESALETQVSPELRHLVSGAVETDYQQIQDALLDRLDKLTREHPFDPRQRKRSNRSIETREASLEQLRARRGRSETLLHELKSRNKEREELEARVLDLRAELAGKEQLLADLESWVRLREEQRKLLKRAPAVGQELVLARRARGQVEEVDRRIAESLGYLASAPDEAEEDLVRLGMLRSQRARHQKTAEAEREKLEGRKSGRPVVAIVIATLLAALIGGIAYGTWKNPAVAALGALLGLGAGVALGRVFGQSAERTRSMAEAQVRVAEENIRTISQEIDQIEIRVNPYVAGRTLEVVLADVKRYRAANQERREAAAVMSSLPTPERLEAESKELDEAVASYRSREKVLLQQSPFLAPLRDDPLQAAEAAERLKREAGALKTKLGAAQEALDAMVKRGGGESDAENLESLDERIAAEEETLAQERRQRDALLLAVEVLRDSVMSYQQQHVGRLAGAAGSTFARLTGGKYRTVALDADFTPTLSQDGRDGIALGSLSRGARDAFYLSLRAAVCGELAAREPLPLILDDPVAHMDEERRGILLGYLEELAEEIQVVLLTHDRRVLNQIRDAHVLSLGTVVPAKESSRKVEARK